MRYGPIRSPSTYYTCREEESGREAASIPQGRGSFIVEAFEHTGSKAKITKVYSGKDGIVNADDQLLTGKEFQRPVFSLVYLPVNRSKASSPALDDVPASPLRD